MVFTSYEVNKNFRVKVNNQLVGFAGLVRLAGYERAKASFQRALRSDCQVFCRRFSGLTIKYYSR